MKGGRNPWCAASGLGLTRDGRVGEFTERADFVDELTDVAKFLVDARKADVRHLIDPAQALHHRIADGLGRYLAVEAGLERVQHILDQHRSLLRIDRTFVAGRPHSPNQFVAVEVLASAISFEYDDSIADMRFCRGEAMTAFQAFTTSPNGRPLLSNSGIDHFVFDGRALGATHRGVTVVA